MHRAIAKEARAFEPSGGLLTERLGQSCSELSVCPCPWPRPPANRGSFGKAWRRRRTGVLRLGTPYSSQCGFTPSMAQKKSAAHRQVDVAKAVVEARCRQIKHQVCQATPVRFARSHAKLVLRERSGRNGVRKGPAPTPFARPRARDFSPTEPVASRTPRRA
jgi:hypothetical protein